MIIEHSLPISISYEYDRICTLVAVYYGLCVTHVHIRTYCCTCRLPLTCRRAPAPAPAGRFPTALGGAGRLALAGPWVGAETQRSPPWSAEEGP